MSEFVKYLRSVLGFGTSEEKSTIRTKKRRLVQEEFENYSQKLRRLNDYKMFRHYCNDDWSEVTPSLKSNYLRHFPNRLQIIEDRRPTPSRPVVFDTIDVSDDDDVIEVSPSKSYTNLSQKDSSSHENFKTNGFSNLNSSKTHSNIVLVARQSINNCNRFFNRSTSNTSSEALRPEEHEIYRDMLLNSPRTSAAYVNSTSLNTSTPNKKYEENSRAKKILSLLKEKTAPIVDLTEDKGASKPATTKITEPITIKDSDSESDSTNRTNRKVSPINSMKRFLESEPFMDPNFIKKLENERTSKRNETRRLIEEESRKREKFSEVNRENVSIILEKLAKKCKITEAIILEDVKEELTFPQLSADQEAEINGALKCRIPSRVFNDKYNLRITAADLKLLNEKEWLNDELINFYVNMIQERSQNPKLPKVYAFSTFFYPKLVSSGYSSLRRWTKRVDLFTYDIIVVPVHLGFHWCMAIIDFRDKSIRYYDSMLGVNMQCLTSLEKYLQEEYRDKKKAEYDTSGWQKVIMKDIPRQMNGSDCGVFSCTFAEFITRNAKILFTQEHMPYIRRKMVLEIIHGKLLT